MDLCNSEVGNECGLTGLRIVPGVYFHIRPRMRAYLPRYLLMY